MNKVKEIYRLMELGDLAIQKDKHTLIYVVCFIERKQMMKAQEKQSNVHIHHVKMFNIK